MSVDPIERSVSVSMRVEKARQAINTVEPVNFFGWGSCFGRINRTLSSLRARRVKKGWSWMNRTVPRVQ
jgi:hypothetical protein